MSWWPGEGSAIDIVGGNSGKLLGGVTFVPDLVGHAFQFNATDASVQVPSSTSLVLGAGEITLDAWINTPPWNGSNPRSGVGSIIAKTNPGYPGQGYQLRTSSDNRAQFWATDCFTAACGASDTGDGGAKQPVKSLSVVADGTFHHVVGVRRANGVREIWVDGVLENTRTEPMLNTDSDNPLYIGDLDGLGNYLFPGIIDEVQVFNRALSPSEIKAIYSARNAGQCKSFSAISMTPNHGGGILPVSIYGVNFQNVAQAKLTASGAPDIVGQNTAVPYSGVITTTFDLTNAPVGLHDVVVSNPDGTTARLLSAFTVEQGGSPDIWVDLIGRHTLRGGQQQTYYIVVGNRGNAGSRSTTIWLMFPSIITWTSDTNNQPYGSFTDDTSTVLLYDISTVIAAGSTLSIPVSLKAPDDPKYAHYNFNSIIWTTK